MILFKENFYKYFNKNDHLSVGFHQLRIKCTKNYVGYPVPEGWHKDGFDVVSIINFNSNNIETYFIIESEGKIFGASGYAYENKQTARVCWVFVDPNHHSNGLGKKLVNHCVDILKRDNQLNVIELETSNLTYKFYEKYNINYFNIIFI